MTIVLRRANGALVDGGLSQEQPLDYSQMAASCRRLKGRPAVIISSSSIDVGFLLEEPFDHG
jgi:hypothetical protein